MGGGGQKINEERRANKSKDKLGFRQQQSRTNNGMASLLVDSLLNLKVGL